MKALAILAALAGTAHATPVAPLAEQRAVSLDAGLDGAIAGTLGVAWGLGVVALWADATLVAGDLDAGDTRYRIGAQLDALRRGRFWLRTGIAAVVRETDATGFAATSFGSALTVAPGVRLGRWTIAVEATLEQTWATHLAPSDTYRMLVFDARDAWYGMSARTVELGAAVAVRLRAIELDARAGLARTGALDFLPAAYATAGAAYRF